ncbi:MAG: glycosyltransferase, partial [Rhodothermales bacterium]|nr:glycosyltransferase [Rhodothermales bacterium]
SAAYASSDIFLFPSETETFGNVTLEAMASGLPTVCADATGSKSLVRHDETGYLVPPGDERAFVRCMKALALDSELRTRFGRRAREVASEYSWPVILGRIDAYYDRLLSERRGEA